MKHKKKGSDQVKVKKKKKGKGTCKGEKERKYKKTEKGKRKDCVPRSVISCIVNHLKGGRELSSR